ncbi:hypothetical protein [Nannocystis bainbridge]|uniref:Uncharacterized protein n=1 Tax=Nannocystis bainbridge TaxID=2995303 RepID=A0ABT5DW15_9BACT|nr:hypothetical protein [Nannocystis bainbridge]MDC0716596.1 hypothetical protein [Nannocystis bainbridge]
MIVQGNTNLRTVAGFDELRDLVGISFFDNPKVESIHLEALETLVWIRIGVCADMFADANNLALGDLAGFGALRAIERITLDGNEALMSAEILDALVANGAPAPSRVTIRYNALLSEESVHLALDELGVVQRDVCGNAGGNPICVCLFGS